MGGERSIRIQLRESRLRGFAIQSANASGLTIVLLQPGSRRGFPASRKR
jgi:hypothetical protein